jgi:poly(A) polymerase
LLPADTVAADKAALRLKLSRKMRLEIAACIKGLNISGASVRAFAFRHGLPAAHGASMLFADDNELPICAEQLHDWTPPAFAVKGGDVIRLGLAAGPSVAKALGDIQSAWVAEGFPGQPRLGELTHQIVSEALLAAKNA